MHQSVAHVHRPFRASICARGGKKHGLRWAAFDGKISGFSTKTPFFHCVQGEGMLYQKWKNTQFMGLADLNIPEPL
ncbi:MAG: hypothetical protein J6J81_00935, partial [Oscillospiraceae bacterium]|nr:hypothetical protein [Oscillospiraceae bacterium]